MTDERELHVAICEMPPEPSIYDRYLTVCHEANKLRADVDDLRADRDRLAQRVEELEWAERERDQFASGLGVAHLVVEARDLRAQLATVRAERDEMVKILRAKLQAAEAELTEARKPATLTDDEQRAVAERIAAWLDERSRHHAAKHLEAIRMTDQHGADEHGWAETYSSGHAADIRSGVWRQKEDS